MKQPKAEKAKADSLLAQCPGCNSIKILHKGQTQPKWQGCIGEFVKLPKETCYQCQVKDKPPVDTSLPRLKPEPLEAVKHEDVPINVVYKPVGTGDKPTQQERIIARIESHGYVDNFWAFNNYILRLSECIRQLKLKGWEFKTGYGKEFNRHPRFAKNYYYIPTKKGL